MCESFAMSRREVLWLGGVVTATATAGCSGFRQPGSTGLVLHNALAAPARVMVTVTNPDREEVILGSEIVTVPRGDQLTVSDEIPRRNGHLVTIDVDDSAQPAKFQWEQVDEPLHVILHQGDIVFTIEPRE